MFGLFKKTPPEAPKRNWDDPGIEAAEGLPLLMDSLHLNRDSRDFERNMAKKLSMFRMLVERSDSDLDLPRKLLASPRRDADGDIDLTQLEEYDALTPYGQACAMLLFALGYVPTFYGPMSATVVKNAIDGDALEARCLIYVCRAYERFGHAHLVAAPVEQTYQTFRPQIEGFASSGLARASEQLVERKLVEIGRQVDNLFVHKYRPARMPGMSTVDPQDIPPLDLTELEKFAMASFR